MIGPFCSIINCRNMKYLEHTGSSFCKQISCRSHFAKVGSARASSSYQPPSHTCQTRLCREDCPRLQSPTILFHVRCLCMHIDYISIFTSSARLRHDTLRGIVSVSTLAHQSIRTRRFSRALKMPASSVGRSFGTLQGGPCIINDVVDVCIIFAR